MSRERFWERVDALLDDRLDPLDDPWVRERLQEDAALLDEFAHARAALTALADTATRTLEPQTSAAHTAARIRVLGSSRVARGSRDPGRRCDSRVRGAGRICAGIPDANDRRRGVRAHLRLDHRDPSPRTSRTSRKKRARGNSPRPRSKSRVSRLRASWRPTDTRSTQRLPSSRCRRSQLQRRLHNETLPSHHSKLRRAALRSLRYTDRGARGEAQAAGRTAHLARIRHHGSRNTARSRGFCARQGCSSGRRRRKGRRIEGRGSERRRSEGRPRAARPGKGWTQGSQGRRQE